MPAPAPDERRGRERAGDGEDDAQRLLAAQLGLAARALAMSTGTSSTASPASDRRMSASTSGASVANGSAKSAAPSR